MTREEFVARYGQPVDDDMDRVNCSQVGTVGHQMCGVCPSHHQPRFMCGCLAHVEKDPKP